MQRSNRFFPRLGLSLLAGLVLLWSCAPSGGGVAHSAGIEIAADPESPKEFGPIPDFALIDQRGRTVRRADLLGRPWVMATIYSRCTGPCPAVSSRMADLQQRLEGTDVLLVSVSVDPDYDSSEVLSDYAASWEADPERWLFLTGAQEEIERFVREGLWMAVGRDESGTVPVGQAVTHDTRLVAIDRQGRRRGWYDQDEPAEVGRLLARMRFLAREDAP